MHSFIQNPHISIKFEAHVETNQMFVKCACVFFYYIVPLHKHQSKLKWIFFFALQTLSHSDNSSICLAVRVCLGHAVSCVFFCAWCVAMCACGWILSNISMDKKHIHSTRHTHKTDEWNPKRHRARSRSRSRSRLLSARFVRVRVQCLMRKASSGLWALLNYSRTE